MAVVAWSVHMFGTDAMLECFCAETQRRALPSPANQCVRHAGDGVDGWFHEHFSNGFTGSSLCLQMIGEFVSLTASSVLPDFLCVGRRISYAHFAIYLHIVRGSVLSFLAVPSLTYRSLVCVGNHERLSEDNRFVVSTPLWPLLIDCCFFRRGWGI